MVPKKPKAYSQFWNIKNFKHRSWNKMFCSKNNQMLWIVKEPNEKLQRYVIIFLWEVIYVYFYNWNRPLDLVPVVYDLIKLIIKASLWTKDYSTFDTHTQHTRFFIQWMLISSMWLYMFKCDVYTQLLVDQTQKDFWVLYIFFKVFLCFHVLNFCLKLLVSCFSSKTSLEGFLWEARY